MVAALYHVACALEEELNPQIPTPATQLLQEWRDMEAALSEYEEETHYSNSGRQNPSALGPI